MTELLQETLMNFGSQTRKLYRAYGLTRIARKL